MVQGDLALPKADRRRWTVDLDDLVAEIWKRHKSRIRVDDPALMVITGFEIVARKLLVEFEGALERSNDDMSALMAQQMETAKGVGISLVEASAAYHVQQLRGAASSLAPEVAAEARNLLQGLALEISKAERSVEGKERRAWVAAAISVGCLMLTVGLIIGRVI